MEIFAGPGIFEWGVDEDGELEADGVVIDLTQGGITATTTTTYYEPTTDQTGTAPVESITTGTTMAINFETPDMDFQKVTKYNPNVTKVSGGTPVKTKFQVSGLAGKKLPRKRAVIKPLGVDDPNQYIYIEACSIKFDLNRFYGLDNNARFTIAAVGYPSLTATPKGLLYTWGDIAVTA